MLWCCLFPTQRRCCPLTGGLFVFFSPRTSSISNRSAARSCLSVTVHLLPKPRYRQELHCANSCMELEARYFLEKSRLL